METEWHEFLPYEHWWKALRGDVASLVLDLESAQDRLAWTTVRKNGTALEYTISGVTYTVELAGKVNLSNEGVYCFDEYNDGLAYVIEIKQKV
ncbi:MAG: hypothetical protein NZ934_00980, partial [Hadesarchaea archaeon]|nr:hypothetical protein [Hadesarchaea archaeon]